MTFSDEQVAELKSAGFLTEDAASAPVEQVPEVPGPHLHFEGNSPAVEQAQPAAEAPTATEADEPKDEPLGEAGLRALQAERAARSKAEAELKSLAGLKGQLTKVTNQVAEVQKERDSFASELARYKVAVTHGLSAEDMDVLPSGVDADALERIAARLSAAGSRRPAPDVNQGRDGAAPDDPKAAFAALLESLD